MMSCLFRMAGWMMSAMMLLDVHAKAQGIERESLSGEGLAQSIAQQNSNQTYNMKLGPVDVRAEADLGATFNDNIGLNKDDRMADILFPAERGPAWQVGGLRPLTR